LAKQVFNQKIRQELENKPKEKIQHVLLRPKAQKKWLAGAAANHLSGSACAAFDRETGGCLFS
jgi:hypothetical protein